MASMVKGIFKKNIFTKLAALMCMSGVNEMKKKLDYRETGGTILLGIAKTVIKAHGSSDERAIFSAIRQAVQANVTEDIRQNVDKMVVPKELEHAE